MLAERPCAIHQVTQRSSVCLEPGDNGFMTEHTRRRLNFLMLGHSPAGATGWPHPATIAVHPRGETTLINFSMGPHIANVGGQVPITRVIHDGELNETFAEEFDACEARWLVPHLARLAAGENLTEDDLALAYEARFGRRPKTETSTDITF